MTPREAALLVLKGQADGTVHSVTDGDLADCAITLAQQFVQEPGNELHVGMGRPKKNKYKFNPRLAEDTEFLEVIVDLDEDAPPSVVAEAMAEAHRWAVEHGHLPQ